MKLQFGLAVIFSVLPLAALAGPREEVLAGTQRCARIADDRNFLDCYYGAAQPLRDQLGLPPAPARQLGLVPPPAGLPSPPPSALSSAPLPQAALPPAPSPSRAVAPAIVGSGTVNVPLASYRMEGDGTFSVTLANGQVWSQLSGDDNVAHFTGPASSIRVTIAPSGLGTQTLSVAGEHGIYKVRRAR